MVAKSNDEIWHKAYVSKARLHRICGCLLEFSSATGQ